VITVTDWPKLFKEATTAILRETQPLFGSFKAKEKLGMGAGGDITRFIDALAESIVIRKLQNSDISCILVSEEKGTQEILGGGTDYVILDGIDGTTNTLHRIPFSATSIAHSSGPSLSKVDYGLVVDLNSGTQFSAMKNRGAYENSKRVSPSTITHLEEAVVSIELSYRKDFNWLAKRLMPVMAHASKLRQLGSTALESAYVASGILDAFVDLRGLSRAVDLAAAALIVHEAGAYIVGPDGKDLDMELGADVRTSFLATGNRILLEEILDMIG
jgi:myo-inositol-1(or 4)-monophosphatase